MLEKMNIDCEVTVVDLCNNSKLNHNNVGVDAIKRYLNKNGLEARRMINTHYMSDSNKEKRVVWAQNIAKSIDFSLK